VEELADVTIYLLGLAEMTGVDLQGDIEAKIERNASSSAIWSARGTLQIWDKRHSNSVYVTISAHPEFVRLVFADQGPGHLDLTGYNPPVTFTPPPANETINDPQLAALATQFAG
jgi:hypothetical protein